MACKAMKAEITPDNPMPPASFMKRRWERDAKKAAPHTKGHNGQLDFIRVCRRDGPIDTKKYRLNIKWVGSAWETADKSIDP